MLRKMNSDKVGVDSKYSKIRVLEILKIFKFITNNALTLEYVKSQNGVSFLYFGAVENSKYLLSLGILAVLKAHFILA